MKCHMRDMKHLRPSRLKRFWAGKASKAYKQRTRQQHLEAAEVAKNQAKAYMAMAERMKDEHEKTQYTLMAAEYASAMNLHLMKAEEI